jgi:hypothetical protein
MYEAGLILSESDPHYSAFGHEVIAERLEALFEDRLKTARLEPRAGQGFGSKR